MTEHAYTEEELAQFVARGEMLAAAALASWQSAGVVNSYVAFNAVGNLVEAIFINIPWDEPGHMLQEFDNWVEYTRSRLVDEHKAKLS
jgi:hypothetical protein